MLSSRRPLPLNTNKPRILSLLGLCKKSGNLSLGFDSCLEAAQQRKTQLILTTMDLSENTRQKLRNHIEENLLCGTDLSMDDIHKALGKSSGIISINEGGFAQKIKQLLYS